MDGTLVDTEPYWMACEHELVTSHGGTWTQEDAHSIVGFDLLDAAAVIRSRGGVDMEPTAIVEHLLDGVIARVRERMPWRPGARRLLHELRQLDVPCALVTMSWTRLVDAVVEQLDPGTFEAVVTGDAVANGKPHPEPYLTAAARLGVAPTDCVAIEDSPTGVASASAAGCVVLAVPNLVGIDRRPGVVLMPSLRKVHPDDLGTLIASTPLVAPPAEDAPTPARGSRAAARRRATIGG
ncbi:MAG: HAD family phosphatase, partial [Acidimicrobiia bacterium]|nr:HAD family phosphatase [Acidimicrobiia bacterium]